MRDNSSADHDRQLRQALVGADSASAGRIPAIRAEDLLEAVGRRRKSLRRARVAALAIVVCGGLVFTPLSQHSRRLQQGETLAVRSSAAANTEPLLTMQRRPPSTLQLRSEIARLKREAALCERVVHGLRRADEAEMRETELVAAYQASRTTSAAEEASRSAAISLQYAVLLERESQDIAQARREYQRVKERFPGTQWGALAAVSLERLAAPLDRSSL